MKDSEILLSARRLIESNRERYICLAILAVSKIERQTVHRQVLKLQRWVRSMLDSDLHSYDGWLARHKPGLYALTTANHAYYEIRVRQARLAWIDWMIAECVKAENARDIANLLLREDGYPHVQTGVADG